MRLRFVFLLITRMASWLRLSRREETWRIAEILLLRHQLAVLPRRQPCRPNLNWADRALLATLLAVIPKARHHLLRLLITRTPARWCSLITPPSTFRRCTCTSSGMTTGSSCSGGHCRSPGIGGNNRAVVKPGG